MITTTRRYRYLFLLLLLFAIVLRIVYLLEFARVSPLYKFPITDAYIYLRWSDRITQGDWLGSSVFWQAPLYPYFIAVTRLVFRDPLLSLYIIQLLIGAIGFTITYRLARELFNEKVALWASFLSLFYAPFIFWETKMLADSLGVFFLLLSTYLIVKGIKYGSYKYFLWAGLVTGIACLNRPILSVYLMLTTIGSYATMRKTHAHHITKAIAYSLVALSIISIATIRNYIVGKDFVFISANSGVVFYNGNNSSSRGGYGYGIGRFIPVSFEEREATRIAEETLGRDLKPSQVSYFWFKKGLSFLFKNPKRALWLMKKKILLSMNNYEMDVSYNIYIEKGLLSSLNVLFIPFGLILSFGIVGMILARSRIRSLWPLYFCVFIAFAALYVFHFSSRYRLPSVPFLAIFAGFGIEELIRYAKEKRLNDLTLYLILIICIMCFSYLPTYAEKEAAPGYTNLGYAYITVQKFDEAIASFKKAISINRRYTPAWSALGSMYEVKGDYKEAIKAYEKLLRLDPETFSEFAKDKIKRCKEFLAPKK